MTKNVFYAMAHFSNRISKFRNDFWNQVDCFLFRLKLKFMVTSRTLNIDFYITLRK